MLVASERFGPLEIADESVIDFPDGILAFPDTKRFAMIDGDEDGVYYWLQAVDDAGLAFLSVIPWAFFPDFEPELTEEDAEAIGLESPSDGLVLCLLSVHGDEGPQVTANLLGPLVVNAKTRLGRQVVLKDQSYPVRAPLAAG